MEELKAKAKKIALNAAEELVKECVVPYVEIKLAEKDPKYTAYFQIFKAPLAGLIDKIDGVEG